MSAQLKKLEMTTMTRKILVAVLGIGSLALGACGSADLAPCQVLPSVQGGYVLHFVRSGSAAAGCDATNPAEFSDVWALNNDFPAQPQGSHGGLQIDYRSATMQPDPPIFGYGKWDAEFSDSSGTCTIPSLDPITGDSNALDGVTTNTITYTTTKMSFLSGAAPQGAAFQATVQVTVGACSASYAVTALSPMVGCSVEKDCDPTGNIGPAPWSGLPPKIFPFFATGCFLQSTHPWVAGAVAFWNLGGVTTVNGMCFIRNAYPSTEGWDPNAGLP